MAADGSIIIKTEVDNKKAQSELKKLEGQIDKLNQKISGKQQTMSPLVEQSKQLGAALDEANRKLYNMQNNTDFYYTTAQVKEQEKTVKTMTAEYNKLNDQIDKMGNSVKADTEKLEEMQSKAGELAGQLAGAGKSTKGMSEAAEAAQQRIGKMSKHIATLARRVLVFSLITAALRKIKNYMWEAIQTNDEAMAAVARLKGALMTLAQPIINVVIPAFTLMVNVITRIVNAISRLVSLLFGTTIQKSAQGAKALNDQKKGIEGVGKAAKEANRYLADFDELNVMDDQNGTDGGGGSGLDAGGGIAPDFTGQISDSLSAIVELFTGAALLGLGAILTFSGANIPLGIALMALGALAIWDTVTENWDIIKTLLQGPLGKAVALIGGALLVIGVVLLFSGVGIPIGLGLILAGATLLGTAAAANWDTIMDILKNPLDHTDILIRGYKLSLGVALLFSGVGIPVGLGLIKDSLNRSVSATPRWDYLKQKLKETFEGIKNWWKGDVAKYFTAKWWNDLGTGVMDSLLSGFKNRWESLKSWVLDKVSWISNAFRPVLDFFTGTKRGGGGSSTSGSFNSNPRMQHMPALRAVQVPALAQGAVIPANREFLAVLGDQKRGTNIEAPADLIRQIFREESGNSGGDIVIRFTGELAQLARVLTPEITRQQRQNQRSWGGGSL